MKSRIEFPPEAALAARSLIALALAEDLSPNGDRTSESVIPAGTSASASFIARSGGVISGLPVAALVAEQFPGLSFRAGVEDGTKVEPKSVIATIAGPYRSLLTAERTALNFVQRMSGIATLTRQYVDAIAGTNAVVLDTRKTIPGWRRLDKYAVLCGGGTNHRFHLADGILIKDNHLAVLGEGSIRQAVRQARAFPGNAGLPVEIEVDSLDQFDVALELKPEIILLDNMPPDQMRIAVERRNRLAPGTRLEASGGITLKSIRTVAETGVDRISVGAITHSAPALDIALDYSL